ncbi:D-alanine--poly(phosphoribitol) ligase subunit 2 [Ruminiclostridium hungatei]|uniref:D-alanine--poly(Phosphoribitol) ligase subunit 2 n=2 Tax=Ruminiclostridium hungatei TaxID=48256 RepID=A0A1V4SGW6_RUMHU|nr:D-alanine--poly(phosphoribitol) ligase subunit 2 [Ruminiclostridium hungatei]
METHMEELLRILKELRPDIDFNEKKALIDDGVLDSFDIVALVGEIGETFDVQIGVEGLVPENFNTVQAILGLINRLRDGE